MAFLQYIGAGWGHAAWWHSATLWLRVLLGLGLVAAAQAWKWRERVLRRRQQTLEALVAERTQELESEKRQLLAAREELRIQAMRDDLTQIWNRRAILDLLRRELERSRRENTPLAVALADLDHFKRVNDQYGHLAGDVVLRQVAARLVEAARPYDGVGRYGGEEFLLVLPGLAPEARARCSALCATVSRGPVEVGGSWVQPSCSIGVAWRDAETQDIEDLLKQADRALYAAKAAGRGRVEFANALPEAAVCGE